MRNFNENKLIGTIVLSIFTIFPLLQCGNDGQNDALFDYFGERISVEEYFRNGCNGIGVEYYTNGGKKTEIHYINARLHGKYIEWYETGVKHSERYYKNNIEDGPSISWYKNGEKKEEKFYINGVLNGESITWYKNGQVKRVSFYKNGYIYYKSILMEENGKKVTIFSYKKNGLVTGEDLNFSKKVSYKQALALIGLEWLLL